MDSDLLLLVQIILIVFHLLIGFAVVYFVYRLLKGFVKLLLKPLGEIQSTPLNLFVSFGIAVLFFPKTILDTIEKLVHFFIYPLKNFSIVKKSLDRFDNHNISNLIFDYLNAWASTFEYSVNEYLLNIPFINLLLFFTLWLLFSLLIREIVKSYRKPDSPEEEKRTTFFQKKLVVNVLTFSIVFFSIYLSIASIIAVPEFQVLESTTIDSSIPEKFKTSLEAQKLYSKKEFKIEIKADSLKTFQTRSLEDLNVYLNSTLKEHNYWGGFHRSLDDRLIYLVVNKFESAIEQKLAPREQAKYKEELTDWYLDQHQNWVVVMDVFQMELLTLQNQIHQFSKETEIIKYDTIKLNGQQKLYPELTAYGDREVRKFYDKLSGLRNDVMKLLRERQGNPDFPRKPKIGDRFGFFKIISGWLLDTESLSLALIVGLFGFGLLGSMGSLFIRRRLRNRYLSEPIVVYDIPGVLINGLSAAVIIFLAVKGAVVIFSTDGDNLNPYVLFFTCLVASVFSEDVWSWARVKLNENLGNRADAESREEENEEEKNED